MVSAADVEARVTAIAAMATCSTPPTPGELRTLTALLGDPSKLVQRRAAEAFAALAARGVDVRPWLDQAAAVSDLRGRWGALYAVSLIGPVPPHAVPTLLEVIGLGDGDLRWAAAELLKRRAAVDRQAVVGALVTAASMPGPRRKMALYCLRDLQAIEGLAAATAALGDGNSDVRLAALAASAALDDDRAGAAERIATLIEDPDPRVRRAAAATLGRLGCCLPVVWAALARAETSDDPSLRRAVADARRRLRRPGGQLAGEPPE